MITFGLNGKSTQKAERGKDLVLLAVDNPASTWFLRRLAAGNNQRQNILRVLTYHRIDEYHSRPHLNPALISATPPAFREQMQFLAENYRVLSMAEVVWAAKNGKPLPPRATLVTFD